MKTLHDDGPSRETETDDPAGRYCGGGHPTEEPDDGRERAVRVLIQTIRQASRELALLMAEMEAERTDDR